MQVNNKIFLLSVSIVLCASCSHVSTKNTNRIEPSPTNNSSAREEKDNTYIQLVYKNADDGLSGLTAKPQFNSVNTKAFYKAYGRSALISAGIQACSLMKKETPTDGKYESDRYPKTAFGIDRYLMSKFAMPNDPAFNKIIEEDSNNPMFKQLGISNHKYFLSWTHKIVTESVLGSAEATYCPDRLAS